MKNRQHGFTLIELMIVVAIIGILAAIAIPAYQSYIIRGQVAEGITLASSARTAATEYYQNSGNFPTNNTVAGLVAPTGISGNYVSQIQILGTGQLQITFGNDAHVDLTGLVMAISPVTNTGSISWTCNSGNLLPARYVPASCR